MQTIVGPILARIDGYAFDTWTGETGLCRGFGYRRIDDAYYARTAALADDARQDQPGAIACDTVDAFVTEVRDAAGIADAVWQAGAAFQPDLRRYRPTDGSTS
jgi:hypothetical protein